MHKSVEKQLHSLIRNKGAQQFIFTLSFDLYHEKAAAFCKTTTDVSCNSVFKSLLCNDSELSVFVKYCKLPKDLNEKNDFRLAKILSTHLLNIIKISQPSKNVPFKSTKLKFRQMFKVSYCDIIYLLKTNTHNQLKCLSFI